MPFRPSFPLIPLRDNASSFTYQYFFQTFLCHQEGLESPPTYHSIRRRKCINGSPGDEGCDESDVEQKECGYKPCPSSCSTVQTSSITAESVGSISEGEIVNMSLCFRIEHASLVGDTDLISLGGHQSYLKITKIGQNLVYYFRDDVIKEVALSPEKMQFICISISETEISFYNNLEKSTGSKFQKSVRKH